MKMIKVREKHAGLIGFGFWGKNILRNLHELKVINKAYDINAQTVAESRLKYPGIDYVSSLDDILCDKSIKAVFIATPAVTHYDLTRKALLSGKDVFIEKPIALNIENGKELVEIAEQKNRVLMVGHILHYHPAVARLKEIVYSGGLGEVQYVYSNRLNIGKFRTEENILWSFAPHDISAVLMLLKSDPVRVSAFGGCYLNRGVYDTTLTTLEFGNDVKAHIFVSWLHPYKEQKLIVVGNKAMAVFDDLAEKKLCLYRHSIKWDRGRVPVADKSERSVVDVPKGEPLRNELEHFLDCVERRSKPETDGYEALKVLKVLESAEKSLGVDNGK